MHDHSYDSFVRTISRNIITLYVNRKKLPRICGTAFQFPELVMSSNMNQSLIPEERMLELREMIGRGLSYGNKSKV